MIFLLALELLRQCDIFCFTFYLKLIGGGVIFRGGSRDSFDGGAQLMNYGAIFSLMNVTNYSPKAVLAYACRSVNLVFFSFGV